MKNPNLLQKKQNLILIAISSLLLTYCSNEQDKSGATNQNTSVETESASSNQIDQTTTRDIVNSEDAVELSVGREIAVSTDSEAIISIQPPVTVEPPTGDRYNQLTENDFILTETQSVSTFSIDADGASYTNTRRYLQEGQIPTSNAIRTEEFINYFSLDYPYTDSSHPINLNGEVSSCPWNDKHKLIRVGIKGAPVAEKPNANFVLLIDVSGSMASEDKLDLLKNGFKYFVDNMSSEDRVAIVTYAGSATVILDSTAGSEKATIKAAIDKLGSGGGTAGAQGIITAYEIAQKHFINGGNNRIIVGTDGDFNIGTSNQQELVELIESKRESGIFLTTLGVGRGNLNEGMLEQLANNGNGNFEYLDNIEQLKKVFVYEYDKFYTVAKDVKVQVDFNTDVVEAYRLIGYENRSLNQEDFEDDTKDAGEIGANQSITAIYEILPTDKENIDLENNAAFTIKFRYKDTQAILSKEMSLDIYDKNASFDQSSDFMKFTASIASFSMLLRDSAYKGSATFEDVEQWLSQTTALQDTHGFKAELRELVQRASNLK